MDIHKKSNKENTRPKLGQQKAVTSFIKRAAPGKTAPLQSKNDQKDGTVEKRAEPTKKPEQRATKSVVSKPTAEAKKTQTLTQTFLSQQSASYKKLLTQGPKPVAGAPPKTLPGTYKGKVIQSKVDCFRKPGETRSTAATDKKVVAKPTVPKAVGPAPATLSRVKSRSVATLPMKTAAPAISQTQPRRPKSVTDMPLSRPASKAARGGRMQTVSTMRQLQVTKRPAATARSVHPTSSRPLTGPNAPTGTARPAPATVKKSSEQMGHDATSQRPARKPVTSTLSHTRVGMETVEERRAKLAEWLAAKGKTLKRPPIHSTQPVQRTRPLIKPKADAEQQENQAESQPAATEPKAVPEVVFAELNPEPVLEAEAVAELEPEEEEGLVTSSPAKAMNTTLDMVDNCELDLPEVDVRLENLVVNLCEALEAMETPSACHISEQNVDKGDLGAEQEVVRMEVRVEEEEEIESEQEVAKNEIKEEFAGKMMESEASTEEREDSGEDSEVEEMESDSIEESAVSSDSDEERPTESAAAIAVPEVKTEVKTEVKEEDDDDEEVEFVDNCGPKTPECNGASVVKFSVRTTPYLQSVKKRIDSESAVGAAPSSCGSSRRQRQSGAATIGDLKFLTPVRRSRRIERQSARLPAVLTEHDPCVTSLAELARLEGGGDGDYEGHIGATMAANAYIYRRNPALLDELPDSHGDLTRLYACFYAD